MKRNNYHLFVSRIPVLPDDKNPKKGFECWYSSSEIAQYTANKPEGPFRFCKVLLKPRDAPAGTWNCGTQHNPTIKYIDGKYVLFFHTNTSTVDNWTKKNHVIGMITATDINGPWIAPKMVLAPPAATDTAIWSHKIFGGIDNPALLKNPKNGKYYLYYRGSYKAPNGRTVNTYGVAISDKLEGPYVHYPKRITNNDETRFIEDPYVFVHKKKIYLLMTDNYLSKGLLLSSDDGLFFDFNEGTLGFDKMNKYVPDSILKKEPNYHADKFDRPSQLKLDGLGVSGGVYAPAIEYNEKNQTFYVINTVIGGIGNFIVKTKDPFKGWSYPIKLPEVKGIDPSIFFDDDGKGYIVNSSSSENPKWNGHSVIWMHEFDAEKVKASAERTVIVDGGPDTTQHPRWLEGPHVYKVDGMYYLMTAEGGTQSGHKEVIFRSEKVKGPYLPYKNNPILTQLGLPADRKNKVTNVGHADLVQTPAGDWYSVFLGCRPYADEQFNTGRETFLLPVKWEDGFPVILENGKEVPAVVTQKGLQPNDQKLTGNLIWRDDFDAPKLDMRWIMLRTPRETWWTLVGGKIEMKALPRSLSQLVNPAFIACRQQHLNFEASTALNFNPTNEKELAGLAYFQNEKNYYVIGKSRKAENRC